MRDKNFPALRDGQSISATGATALNDDGPNSADVMVDNRGTVDAYIRFGFSGVSTTVATGVRVPANSIAVFGKSTATHIAVAVVSGTPALTLHFGDGC